MHGKLTPTPDFLTGGGEMGALMRAHDWSTSPLGPPGEWPQSLRSVVSLMLTSKFPMFIAWGPELAFLYNDGYRPIFGAKHPHALGLPFREVWSDIWDDIEPLVQKALAGEATYHEDLHLVMERNGYPEDTWYTFSYSPVRDETGGVAGMFCACTETTQEVKSRAAMKAEQDRLRELFQQAPGFMAMLFGRNHVFELVNDAYLQLIGHRHDIIGKPAREALPDIEGQGFFELLDKVYATGEPFVGRSVRVGLQREPGSPVEERFLDLLYQPITDKDGRVTGIFAEGYDITERVQAEQSLRASEARLRLAIEAGRMATFAHENGKVTATPELKHLLGYPADAELDVEEVQSRYYPGERERLTASALEALGRGDRFFEVEYRHYRLDGDLRWFLLRGEIELDPNGVPTRTIGVVLDITDRKRAEEALRAREAELSAAMDAGSLAPFDFDHVTGVLSRSPRVNELFGYPPERQITSADLRARYHPDNLAAIWAQSSDELKNPAIRNFDWTLHLLMPNGRTRWINGRGEYIRDESGHVVRSRGIAMDITERKRWEEHQRLLINELNHRVKNTLTTVQSIAAQSLRPTSEENGPKLQSFEGRLFALARAHDVLTRENWEGVELREVIDEVLEPYLRQTTKHFEIEGPRLRLDPRRALGIAMTIHELATNAIKYGALSVPTGCVTIAWEVSPGDPAHLVLRWQERDGPPVEAPTRKGFGTRLIERGLSQDLGGQVQLQYEPKGIVCVMNVPLGSPDASSEHSQSSAA